MKSKIPCIISVGLLILAILFVIIAMMLESVIGYREDIQYSIIVFATMASVMSVIGIILSCVVVKNETKGVDNSEK